MTPHHPSALYGLHQYVRLLLLTKTTPAYEGNPENLLRCYREGKTPKILLVKKKTKVVLRLLRSNKTKATVEPKTNDIPSNPFPGQRPISKLFVLPIQPAFRLSDWLIK